MGGRGTAVSTKKKRACTSALWLHNGPQRQSPAKNKSDTKTAEPSSSLSRNVASLKKKKEREKSGCMVNTLERN